MRKKIILGFSIGIGLLIIALLVYILFFNKVSDEKLLTNLEDEIIEVDKEFTKVEKTEEELQVDINEDVSENEVLLDELSSEISLVETDLDKIETAETELNSSIN